MIARPGHAESLYRQASALAAEGRDAQAQQAYLAAIAAQPDHFGALNDLGALLYRTDFRTAARTLYAEAVKHHPDNPIGRINLANALLENDQLEEARAHYEAALRLAPEHPDAHQGMANLLRSLGQFDAAEHHIQMSVQGRGVVALPYRGSGDPCRVLLLVSAGGGNVPTRFLLDEAQFAVFQLPVEAHEQIPDLPPHDLVFNAVGDADRGAQALDAAARVLMRTDAPMINPPDQVRQTGRAAIAGRLAALPGVRAPRVEMVPREMLKQSARRFGYPLLLRSPGFHTGKHFQRVDGPDDLAAAANSLPGRRLLMMEFLDARDAQGRARKYRAMIVGGQVLPLHLALSNDWKVHYFTADMAERPDHRALEAAFLQNMPGVLGARAMTGLQAIADTLGLDYAGVDFGLGADGEVLLFEANATMVVNPPEPDPRWDYRRAPVARILDAVHTLLKVHARVNTG
jgi:glutathione synthase/RimK-type ligase-like ATP-grasp enzyme